MRAPDRYRGTLGGDEFVVLLEDLSTEPREAANQADALGNKLLAALNRPYDLNGYPHRSTSSIGVAVLDDQASNGHELLKRADLAMYRAKATGRNAIRFFDPTMQAAASSQMELETDFRESLEQGAFSLVYQPQVTREGKVTGVEALIRWQHPVRGNVPPFEFIPLAEETGLIVRLGRWVLQTACAQLAAWSRDPVTASLTMSVNISAREFRSADFVRSVIEILDRSGADPRLLKLELTETVLLEDAQDAVEKMMTLQARGLTFPLDDFGTGYSSLSYLKRLPLHQLKIDRSFVNDVPHDPQDVAISQAIIALGQNLGLAVIAEGVETQEQLQFLSENGCDAYQGFLLSRPVKADELQGFMASWLNGKALPRIPPSVCNSPPQITRHGRTLACQYDKELPAIATRYTPQIVSCSIAIYFAEFLAAGRTACRRGPMPASDSRRATKAVLPPDRCQAVET